MESEQPEDKSAENAGEAAAGAPGNHSLRFRFLAPLVIFVLALGLRIIFIWQVHTSRIPDLSRVSDLRDDGSGVLKQIRNDGTDMESYDHIARWILKNGWFEKSTDVSPLYPCAFLPAVYSVTGGRILPAKMIQAVVDSCTVLLIYLLALRLYGRRAGVYAGLAAAVYAPFIIYQGHLLGEFLLNFFVVAFFVVMLGYRGRMSIKRAIAAGVLFGLAVAAKPTALVFWPLAVVWMWQLAGWRFRRVIAPASIATACALVVILPFSYRNYRASGQFQLVRGNSGKMLYMGNNLYATGAYHEPTGEAADNLARETASMSLSEKDRVYALAALRFARENPMHFLLLLWRKFGLFFSAAEVPNNLSVKLYRQVTFLGSWGFLSFAIVCPLGVAGFLFSLKRPGVWFVLAQALVYSAAIILFVVVGRYRLAIVPLILPAAGFALAEMVVCVRDRHFARGLGILIPVLAVALPMNYRGLRIFAREKRNPAGFETTRNGSLTVHDDSNYPMPFSVGLQGDSLALKFLLLDEIPPGATRADVLIRLRVAHMGTLKVCLNNYTHRVPLAPSGKIWLRVAFPIAAVNKGLNSISLRPEGALVARVYADDVYDFKRSIYSPDGRTGRNDRLDRDTYRRCPSLHMGAHELKVRLELTTAQAPPSSSRTSP